MTTILLTLFGLALVFSASSETSENDPAAAPVTAINKDSILAVINAEYLIIKPILRESCFDCHSDKTDYPWYHSLPVIGSMIDDHVKEGREHLDLTNDFPFATKNSLRGIVHEIKEEIEDDGMPIRGYRLLHRGAAIEDERRDSVFAWVDSALARMEAFGLGVGVQATKDH